jgi:hypothetical protein
MYSEYEAFKAEWWLYIPQFSTFKSSALFPHGVFTVSPPYDSWKKNTISSYSINRMFFFVVEDLSVDCEVGNEFLNLRLIVVKVPMDYYNSLLLSWPRLPQLSGDVPACTSFLCHKVGCLCSMRR